jgi:hypothetical protein
MRAASRGEGEPEGQNRKGIDVGSLGNASKYVKRMLELSESSNELTAVFERN